jgi:hypothetical protein
MVNKNKINGLLIAVLLLVVVSPAQAQAPLLTETKRLHVLALQEPKQYAAIKIKDYGWNVIEFKCLSQLWGKESGWNYKADNPTSSAYGIAQMLKEKAKHPKPQIDKGLRYIKHRYDKPCNAWKYWQRHKWY